MGGDIGVGSMPGLGSLFWVEIPMELGEIVQAGPPGAGVNAREPRPSRILIAEDVEINREVLNDVLARQNHTLAFAANGAEAVALAEEEPFDLVLMDVQMPEMDGVEATRRIRRLPAPACTVPIIALTANVLAKEQERYLRAGMNECLMKPIDFGTLSATIGKYVGFETSTTELNTSSATSPVLHLGWAEGLPRNKALSLVRRAIDASEQLAALSPISQNLTAEAHRVAGSAGTVGLQALGSKAAEIETLSREGKDPAPALRDLGLLVNQAKLELKRQELG
jgi:CheY-like chemotaxis protein